MNGLIEIKVLKDKIGDYTQSQIANAMEVLETPYEKQSTRALLALCNRRDEIRKDAVDGISKYRGKTGENMEAFRKETLDKIKKAENVAEALDLLMDGAKKILEHCAAIKYISLYEENCRVV